MLSVLRRKSADAPWVGLLARRGKLLPTASPSPVDRRPSGLSKRRTLTHSGGTAPDLHRLPCYARHGHQRRSDTSIEELGGDLFSVLVSAENGMRGTRTNNCSVRTHDRRRVTDAPSRAAAPALLSARDQSVVRDGTAAPGLEMWTAAICTRRAALKLWGEAAWDSTLLRPGLRKARSVPDQTAHTNGNS